MTKEKLYELTFLGVIIATVSLVLNAILNGQVLTAISVGCLGIVAAVSQIILLKAEEQDE